MENECESGKGGECYLLFQRFFCEKQYNSSGYETRQSGIDPANKTIFIPVD